MRFFVAVSRLQSFILDCGDPVLGESGPRRKTSVRTRTGRRPVLYLPKHLSNIHFDKVRRCNPAQAGHVSPNTMAATVEAILGAVYLDGEVKHVSQVMQTLGLVST